MSAESTDYGPWHPGLTSDIPPALLGLSTIFRPENTSAELASIIELHALTGLHFEELIVFRPERLIVHELLVRVTADLSVPDGPRVEDLGINFRHITHTILTRHIAPQMDAIVAEYQSARKEIEAAVT